MFKRCFRFRNIPQDFGIQRLNCTGHGLIATWVGQCNYHQDDHCDPNMPSLSNRQNGPLVKCKGT